jgi:hypothetical protein
MFTASQTYPAYQDPFGDQTMSLASSDLDEHVETLLMYARMLTPEQKARLTKGLRLEGSAATRRRNGSVVYDASFDVAGEVEQQINAVKAIRDAVMPNGVLAEGISARDAKDVVTSGSTLLVSLMRFHKEIVNMNRLRNLERAVVEVLMEESPELRERVVARLAERLESK